MVGNGKLKGRTVLRMEGEREENIRRTENERLVLGQVHAMFGHLGECCMNSTTVVCKLQVTDQCVGRTWPIWGYLTCGPHLFSPLVGVTQTF